MTYFKNYSIEFGLPWIDEFRGVYHLNLSIRLDSVAKKHNIYSWSVFSPFNRLFFVLRKRLSFV